MRFEFEVHGLWIIGTVLITFGSLILGNIEWVEGTTRAGFVVSLVLAFLLVLLGGMFWISAAVNANRR